MNGNDGTARTSELLPGIAPMPRIARFTKEPRNAQSNCSFFDTMKRPTSRLCKTSERPVSIGTLSLFNFADMNDDPIIIASTENAPTDCLDFLGDIGNLEIPEVNLDFFDFDPDEVADTDNRYVKPKLVPMKTDQVLYDNAAKLARELKIEAGSRYDCLVSGSFIFSDFIEAFMVYNQCVAQKMTITTLSLSQENIDSLANLLHKGYIKQLDMIISDYFYSHERHQLIPYMYHELDIDNRFQLSVAFVHTKTVHMTTLGGKKIVIHGSANLRTSGNCEQFTIEENPELHDFYEERFAPIIERFATIRKTQWKDMTTKRFKT